MSIFLFHEDYLKLFRQMKDIKLTQEEQELLTSIEDDERLSVTNLEQKIKCYQSCAAFQIGEAQGGVLVQSLF